MNVYKLKYQNKESAIIDLKAKRVYVETEEVLTYGQGVQAIVEIGKICLNQPTEEIPPVIADGYHFDVMCEQEIDFGINSIIVGNPKHSFAGY